MHTSLRTFCQTWPEIRSCNEAEIQRIFGSSLQKFLTSLWAHWLQQVPAGLPVLQPAFHRHLRSQFGEMFNGTCRSKAPVVSGNQAPACPFTLENFPHKFWVMVKSCKGELLSRASLGGKKARSTPDWLERDRVLLSELADTRKNRWGKTPVSDIQCITRRYPQHFSCTVVFASM